VTFSPALTVQVGTTRSVILAYDVNANATPGNKLTARLVAASYVTPVAPDTVSSVNFPITNPTVTITDVPDELAVTSTDKAPMTAYVGQENVVMQQLTLTPGSNTVQVNSLTFTRGGIGVDADVASVVLYHDVDESGTLTDGDVRLCKDPDTNPIKFSAGQATVALDADPVTVGVQPFIVDYSTPAKLLVVLNLSGEATLPATVQTNLASQAFVAVESPDTVAAFVNLQSSARTIQTVGDTLSLTSVRNPPLLPQCRAMRTCPWSG